VPLPTTWIQVKTDPQPRVLYALHERASRPSFYTRLLLEAVGWAGRLAAD
jgi:hypothetical protein